MYSNPDPFTSDTVDLSTDNEWSITVTGQAFHYTYNYMGAFPSIVDNFPDTITKSAGAMFTFNTANVTGADSIIVALQCDTTFVYKTGSATGTIYFSPGELQTIASNTADTLKHTCFMNLTYYRYTIQTFGGRRYAFAKCGHYIKDITINE